MDFNCGRIKKKAIEARITSSNILETLRGSYENQGVMKTVTSPIPKDKTWFNLLWLTSICIDYIKPVSKSLKAAPEGTAFSV